MRDIILLGAEYEDVPAVNLPAVGGGTAKFTDASVVTATPSDVASGKVFVDANGDEQTGTASGGSAVIEALNVTANGTYTAPTGVDGYSPVTVNVSGGGGGAVSESDVNFYDYDGTLLYSHTKAEINAMTADSDLPANPSHSGLTAQGWNWTVAKLKTQLTAMPDQPVNVGQMYVTDDDKTRIYVHLEEGRTSPYLGICPKGTVTIDWGDGSATSTLTGTSLTSVKTVQHFFPDETADYMITLAAASGTTFAFYGVSNTSHILKKSTATTSYISRVYTNAVKKIELGSAARIGNYAFCYCGGMTSITIPDSVTSIGTYAFYCCSALHSITIPDGVTSIGNYVFQYCYSLASITIPDNVTSIGNYAFQNCSSLASVTIPDSVTSIGNYAFQTCNSLASITIPDSVTSIGTYEFTNCYSIASITIPDGVTSIGTNAFYQCYNLASITIPDGVTSIGANMFYRCYNLASVTIPEGVTSIEAQAFNSCYGLAEFHFKPTTPPTVANSNAWTSIPTDCKIYVPTGSLSAYTSATNYPASSTYTYVEE